MSHTKKLNKCIIGNNERGTYKIVRYSFKSEGKLCSWKEVRLEFHSYCTFVCARTKLFTYLTTSSSNTDVVT